MRLAPRVRLVKDGDPSDSASAFYAELRRRKFHPVPDKPAIHGTPLVRERLTSRRLHDVVVAAVSTPDGVGPPPWLARATAGIAIVLLISAWAAGC